MVEITIRKETMEELIDELKAYLGAVKEMCDEKAEAEADDEVPDNENISYALKVLCNRLKVKNYRELSIEELDLPVVVDNVLKRVDIRTVGDLLEYSEKEVLSIRGIGPQWMDTIKSTLDYYGLSFSR